MSVFWKRVDGKDDELTTLGKIAYKFFTHLSHSGWVIISIPGLDIEVFHICNKGSESIRAKFLKETDKIILCPNCLEELLVEDIYSKMPQLVLTLIRKPN